jgi:hypothetical protein
MTTPRHHPPISATPSRVAEFVAFCEGAADEAAAAVAEAKPCATWADLYPAARDAFLNALPVPSTPEMTQAFISCIVHGVALGFIPTNEAGTLLNIAQEARQVQRTMLWAQQLGHGPKTPLFVKNSRERPEAVLRKKKRNSGQKIPSDTHQKSAEAS